MAYSKPNDPSKQAQNCSRWERFASAAAGYDALLCDIWGVVHNGVQAAPACVDALERYRKQGGRVLLITNAPRPSSGVRAQLEGMGVLPSAYDEILTSGDLTHQALAENTFGAYCYHIGPKRDLGLFENAKTEQVGLSEAQFILCTGLKDDSKETAEDYRDQLEIARGRGLRFICANPDVVVERAGVLIPCAGALAALYQELGGEVVYFGKPYPPIYHRALELLGVEAPAKILAIGDGLLTDIKGASEQGIDSLFILGGIAADIDKDADSVQRFCATYGVYPHAFMTHFCW